MTETSGPEAAVLIVGAGGHARVVLAAADGFSVVGLLTPDLAPGAVVDGVAVLGGDDLLTSRYEPAHVAIGDNVRRRAVVQGTGPRAWLAVVSPHALLVGAPVVGEGVFVGARAVIQPGGRIGRHAIVNTGAIVEHDCLVGDFAHVAPGAVLCGGVRVGDGALIGTGAILAPGVVVGADAVVGAGAVVLADVPDGVTVVGNPARPLER